MKSMTFTAGLLASMISLGTYGYDDFESGKLDLSKWQTQDMRTAQEIRREVVGDYLLFEERFTGGYGDNNARSNLHFTDPGSINSVSVPVYIEAMESEGNASTRFRLYMDHLRAIDSDPGGRLEVMVDIEKRAGQPMQARYYLGRCEDDTCSTVDEVEFETGFVPVSLNTWHTLGLSWSPDSITFSVDGFNHTFSVPDGITLATFPAEESWVFLGSRFRHLNSTADSGYVRARVGDIRVNGQLYEDYSSGRLDASKWLNPEPFERRVDDGKLNMRIAIDSTDGKKMLNQLLIRENPEVINTIAADLSVISASYTGNIQPRARLAGNWYNTGLAGGGEVGDMYADVLLYVDGQDLKGRALVYLCTDEHCQNGQTLFFDNQIGPFNFGETYPTSLEWTGEQFLFQIGPHSRSYTPVDDERPASAAKASYKAIGVRMSGSSGSGDIQASFDNVTINKQGYTVFSNDEKLIFVPSKKRRGEVDLITTPGEQLTLSHFDLDKSILDFSVLLSKLHQQNALQNVRFDATPEGGDLVLRLQRTAPQETLARVVIEGQAGLDPETIKLNLSARPFADWYFPAMKALVGAENATAYLKGFELGANGAISHAYDFANEITVAVRGQVVAGEGEYAGLLGQEITGEYRFDIDIAKGIDEFSHYPNPKFDPKYSLRSDQQLGFANFNQTEFSAGFHGVSVSYEPGFNWQDEFESVELEDIPDTQLWQNYLSYLRFPKGEAMVPGPYAILELNAFTTESDVDPDTGESIGVENGTEILLFAATDASNPFENWLDWFPSQANFIVLNGHKLGEATAEGEEQKLGEFFVKLDEVTLTSGGFQVSYSSDTQPNPGPRRRGMPVWLPALLIE